VIRVAGPTVTNLFPSYDRNLGQGLNCTTLTTQRGEYTGRIGSISVVTTSPARTCASAAGSAAASRAAAWRCSRN
jgi:hypothetical protein